MWANKAFHATGCSLLLPHLTMHGNSAASIEFYIIMPKKHGCLPDCSAVYQAQTLRKQCSACRSVCCLAGGHGVSTAKAQARQLNTLLLQLLLKALL